MNKNKCIKLIIQLSIILMFFILWELFSRMKIIDSFLFSSPINIIKIFIEYLKQGQLFNHVFISLFETIISLLIGTALGIVISMFLWYFPFVQKILSPFLVVFNALPKTALAPIIIIWIGTGVDGIIVVAISIFIIMTIITSLTGFNQIEEEKIKMMYSFEATKTKVLFKLILPGNFLNIVSLIKVNIGLAWVGVIVGEFLVSKAGIGYLILYGTQVFKMDLVMMGVFILAFISFGMYLILSFIENKLKKRGVLNEK